MYPKLIIYPLGDGIAVIYPTDQLAVKATAIKDVPEGVPYKIITSADLPSRDTRGAWEADFTECDGIGGVR